jgi:branched-chain amino acid transport system permease protein
MTLLGQLLLNGIYIGSVYALLGLSFAVIFAATKIWHFAQGAVYAIGAYAVLVLVNDLGVPLVIAVVASGAVTALAGVLCLRGLYGPMRRVGASPLIVVMGSLGLMVVVENVLALVFGPSGYSLDLGVVPVVPFLGLRASVVQLVAPGVALAAVGAVAAFLYRSAAGRRLRALVNDPELLTLNGVETRRLELVAFAIGSALLVLPATLLMASSSGVSPFVGVAAVLTGAMAMFLGGVDSYLGAALGGFVIGVVENLSVWLLPTEWQSAVTYALLLCFLLVRPTGLLGRALPQSSL